MKTIKLSLVAIVLTLAPAFTFCQINLQNGLIAYWPFEGYANDSSGNGNNGTLIGDASFTAGIIGNALQLDGDGDYIEVNNGVNVPLDSSLSVTAWVNLTDLAREWHSVIGKKTNNDTMSYWVGTHFGKPSMGINKGGDPAYGVTANSVLDSNQWYFLAFTVCNGIAKVYINKLLDNTNSGLPVRISQTNSLVVIGNVKQTSTGLELEGYVDELRLYSRCLNNSEIDALYLQGVPDTTTTIAENPLEKSIQVYPNPFSKELFVESASFQKGDVAIRLSDMLGREIFFEMKSGSQSQRLAVKPESELTPGIYFLEVRMGVMVQRVLVLHTPN